ncbi:MAG: 5'/3'-nucleotidase SurE [Gammaproteobacteria bacterium]|nr:5'/3'-nucleotidase SurE [Gammaproteobacteria bacterium]
MHSKFIVFVAALLLAPLAGLADGLHILLTNDDGYLAPGINAVHEALLEAGHTVTVVAPNENQSGSRVRVTTGGELSVIEREDDVWSVGGSPADSVLVAIHRVMAGDPPDLVVSGANFGQNLARGTSSGTVGAATTAAYAGFPAIAISVGIDFRERELSPRFPSTMAAFPGAASFLVGIIDQLMNADADRLMPAGTVLNISYPALPEDQINGARVLPGFLGSDLEIRYEDTGTANTVAASIGPRSLEAGRIEGTDVGAFRDGYIVISVFDGNWNAENSVRDEVRSLLGGFDWLARGKD